MRSRYQRRSSGAALWSKRIGIFSLVLFLMSIAAHRLSLVATVDLFVMAGVVGSLAILALLLAGLGYRALWIRGDRAGASASGGVFFALLCLAPMGWLLYQVVTLPPLHDISTDLDDPPFFAMSNRSVELSGNRLADLPADTARLQQAAYPAVLARRYDEPVDIVVGAALSVIKERGWPLVAQTGSLGSAGDTFIDTRYYSYITGFTHSLVLRITDETGSSYVDMRSASHFGRHDFGTNARLVERFLRDLDFAVATVAN